MVQVYNEQELRSALTSSAAEIEIRESFSVSAPMKITGRASIRGYDAAAGSLPEGVFSSAADCTLSRAPAFYGPVFFIEDGEVLLENLIIDGGFQEETTVKAPADSLLCLSGGSLRLGRNAILQNNVSAENGGGASLRGEKGKNCILRLSDNACIRNCRAAKRGGAVFLEVSDPDHRLALTDYARLEGNTADYGGAICLTVKAPQTAGCGHNPEHPGTPQSSPQSGDASYSPADGAQNPEAEPVSSDDPIRTAELSPAAEPVVSAGAVVAARTDMPAKSTLSTGPSLSITRGPILTGNKAKKCGGAICCISAASQLDMEITTAVISGNSAPCGNEICILTNETRAYSPAANRPAASAENTLFLRQLSRFQAAENSRPAENGQSAPGTDTQLGPAKTETAAPRQLPSNAFVKRFLAENIVTQSATANLQSEKAAAVPKDAQPLAEAAAAQTSNDEIWKTQLRPISRISRISRTVSAASQTGLSPETTVNFAVVNSTVNPTVVNSAAVNPSAAYPPDAVNPAAYENRQKQQAPRQAHFPATATFATGFRIAFQAGCDHSFPTARRLPRPIITDGQGTAVIPDQIPVKRGRRFTGWQVENPSASPTEMSGKKAENPPLSAATRQNFSGRIFQPGEKITGVTTDLILRAVWETL